MRIHLPSDAEDSQASARAETIQEMWTQYYEQNKGFELNKPCDKGPSEEVPEEPKLGPVFI